MAMQDFRMLFEKGENDNYWCIEEDAEGYLYVTSNAETRRLVGPQSYTGWDMDELLRGLLADNVPKDIARRYVEQAS